MKKLAFPTLFAIVLLGLWAFTKSQGGAAPTSSTPPPRQQPSTTTTKPDELTDKEEMFAATLNPRNQEIFTEQMSKKQRTMAMEMVIENNRSGGGLTTDQVVEQLSKDFNIETPPNQPTPPPYQTPAETPPPEATYPPPPTETPNSLYTSPAYPIPPEEYP